MTTPVPQDDPAVPDDRAAPADLATVPAELMALADPANEVLLEAQPAITSAAASPVSDADTGFNPAGPVPASTDPAEASPTRDDPKP